MRKTQEDGVLVTGVHRAVRRLTADEGPWPGTLVDDGDGVAVWCDLGHDEAAIDWRFAGAEHVAAPSDVARSAQSHGALLPWCTVRVSVFLARRAAAGVPLEPGEWGTLIVSILRGLREIVECAEADLRGQWWLSHEGRPLCVPGGETPARDGAVEVLQLAQDACQDRALRRILQTITEAVAESMPTRARTRIWEREILDFAAPRALRLDAHPPQEAREAVVHQMRAGAHAAPSRRLLRVRAESRWARISVRVPIERMREFVRSRSRVRPASRTTVPAAGSQRSHRRTVVVAAAAAALVLGIGLAWPDQDDEASEAAETRVTESPTATPSAPAEDAATGTSTPEPAPDDATDPVAAVPGLLVALDACRAAADEGCPEAIAPGSGATAADVLRSDAAGSGVLVDDYGDLAVIRLGTEADGEQMLVLVSHNEKWLVRDVYDVADQPEKG